MQQQAPVQPDSPPPHRPPWRKRHPVLFVLGIAAAAGIPLIITVTSATGGGGGKTASPPKTTAPSKPKTTAPQQPRTTAPQTPQQPATPATPAPIWHTIATFTGSANTNTPQFTISDANGGNWVMKYTYDCSQQINGQGNFIVNEDGMQNMNPSAVALNNLDAGQTSQTNVYDDAGTHYLQIQTECPYTITVEQQY